MPKPLSLGLNWQTDLIFARFDGVVHDRGDYVVVRSPANPHYWWGNFVIFRKPPVPGDLARWVHIFDTEIRACQPGTGHHTFGIDQTDAWDLPAEFKVAGFSLNQVITLERQCHQGPPPYPALAADLQWRVLDLTRHSDLVVDQQVAVDADRYHICGYRLYAECQMARYAAMQHAGLGHWFGIVSHAGPAPQIVASCGLFRDPTQADLGRFQYVSTHPLWQRRGLCTALVAAVSRYGFDTMGLRTQVIVADPAEHALPIYRSLGFQAAGGGWQLERPPA